MRGSRARRASSLGMPGRPRRSATSSARRWRLSKPTESAATMISLELGLAVPGCQVDEDPIRGGARDRVVAADVPRVDRPAVDDEAGALPAATSGDGHMRKCRARPSASPWRSAAGSSLRSAPGPQARTAPATSADVNQGGGSSAKTPCGRRCMTARMAASGDGVAAQADVEKLARVISRFCRRRSSDSRVSMVDLSHPVGQIRQPAAVPPVSAGPGCVPGRPRTG